MVKWRGSENLAHRDAYNGKLYRFSPKAGCESIVHLSHGNIYILQQPQHNIFSVFTFSVRLVCQAMEHPFSSVLAWVGIGVIYVWWTLFFRFPPWDPVPTAERWLTRGRQFVNAFVPFCIVSVQLGCIRSYQKIGCKLPFTIHSTPRKHTRTLPSIQHTQHIQTPSKLWFRRGHCYPRRWVAVHRTTLFGKQSFFKPHSVRWLIIRVEQRICSLRFKSLTLVYSSAAHFKFCVCPALEVQQNNNNNCWFSANWNQIGFAKPFQYFVVCHFGWCWSITEITCWKLNLFLAIIC